MYQSTYYVDKTTDTFADTLLAYGIAGLLNQIMRDNGEPVTVRVGDIGGVFSVSLTKPLREGYENVRWFCNLPFIRTKSKKPPDEWLGLGLVVDYDAERQRNTAYFAARKQLPKEARRAGATPAEFSVLAQVEALKPRKDWQTIAQINQMSAISAYGQVLEAWFECRACFPDLLRLLLRMFSTTPDDVAGAVTSWKALAKRHDLKAKETTTPVQVLNPAMGKGINRPKADGADRLGNPDSFWPLEFLKFWGLWSAGVPRVIQTTQGGGRGPRDRKTYVLHPVNITLGTHEIVFREFNESMWANTAIKMDVLAALRYTDIYLKQWLAGQHADADWDEEPGNHIRGLTTAFYKDMGSAVALLNLSEVALPQWMRITNQEQGTFYRDLLEEHQRIVSSLNEGKSEQYRLLKAYRNFLSGHDLDAFFQFTGIYSTLLMSRIESGEWAPHFLTSNLEVLIMGHDKKLKPILENRGFQNLATAIRRSTVTPQYFKARGDSRLYEIRYGLGAELLRQAAYPDRFMQALSEFMHAFNRENAQINERYGNKPPIRRSQISTEDIAQVVALVDEYGSQTVGNLLVAFGYAREPKEVDQQQPQPPTTDEVQDEQ